MPTTLYRLSRFLPGPSDAVFGFVLALVLVGGRHGLLNDPGTPWHLRLGREIIASHDVPRSDTLTFTREGAAWVDQSWAFDVLLALVVDHWGWSAAIALAALGLAWLYRTMTRDMIRLGTSPVIAAVVSVFAVCIGAIHFLLRPHLFTFGFVYLALRACKAQHERGGWAVLKVAIYTAVLANLHGGFVALPVIVATSGLGHALSGDWDAARKRNAARFGLAFLACCLAALANPYGFGLYRHVGGLLVSSGVTSLIIEYQPPHFGTAEAQVLEWVLLALIGLPVVLDSAARPLSTVPRAGLAAPDAHVDPKCAAVCAGGGAGSRHTDRRLAALGACRVEARGAAGVFAGSGDLRRVVRRDERCDAGWF